MNFPHSEHLRLAYTFAQIGGTDAAVAGARRIREFAGPKYHDTLTVGWARVVAHLVEQSPELDFDAFLAANPQLQRRDLLLAHYSRERLFSPDARAAFVEPDLLALP
jgi:hypothetical protein